MCGKSWRRLPNVESIGFSRALEHFTWVALTVDLSDIGGVRVGGMCQAVGTANIGRGW